MRSKREPTVIGVAGHNGWAVFVRIAARDGAPEVLDRRRVELIEPGLPNQPYHHETIGMDPAQAEELVKEVQESALRCAERALARLQSTPGEELAAIAVRDAVLPHLPKSVAEAHASNHVLARADAMLYHHALCEAAAALGIPVEPVPRGAELERAAETLKTDPPRLDCWLAGLRSSLGPPWQKDHQSATARAIVALGKRAKFGLPNR